MPSNSFTAPFVFASLVVSMLDQLLPWRLEANYVVLMASTALFCCMSIFWLVRRKTRSADSP
jgi:hypothetical protein